MLLPHRFPLFWRPGSCAPPACRTRSPSHPEPAAASSLTKPYPASREKAEMLSIPSLDFEGYKIYLNRYRYRYRTVQIFGIKHPAENSRLIKPRIHYFIEPWVILTCQKGNFVSYP